ncbi:hypothetical protein [Desulfospira joergensenii]|uniref:hypothetical protein n=1 Tax=Desulfospira joergensenii TaxID=53329 RepID=UPI0003B67173|nr:hypothetical protein [Desulfospira joergensenii]
MSVPRLSCLFCKKDITFSYSEIRETLSSPDENGYICPRCGVVSLHHDTRVHFNQARFSNEDLAAISITLRNDWERKGRGIPTERQNLKFNDLTRIIAQFKPLDPLEMMDNALLNIDRRNDYVGQELSVYAKDDYPYYFCKESNEMRAIIGMLCSEGFLYVENELEGHLNVTITTKGYQRLREIERLNLESKQAFVAMWFNPSMNDAYNFAIEPAVREAISGFHALKIDNKEHIDDINDAIIGEIRRSRFMVCDLTGYRGGVYFEAGFAYGLGLPVIYTCRNDWVHSETLLNAPGYSH